MLALGAVLKQQKRRHSTVVVDPATVAASHRPCRAHRPLTPTEGGWRGWAQFGERPDNLWMQYDSGSAPRDAQQWQQTRFVHKMKWGYSCWPAQMHVYKQRTDDEPPEPPPEGTEPAVEEVQKFLATPEAVTGLVGFLSLEEHKGRDVFAEAAFILFKVWDDGGRRTETARRIVGCILAY